MSTPAKTSAYALAARLIRQHIELTARLAQFEPNGTKGPPLAPEIPHPDTVVELERMASQMEAAAVIVPIDFAAAVRS